VSLLEEIVAFLYREARFADEGRYDDWEALWTDDGVYWVPAAGDEGDVARSRNGLHGYYIGNPDEPLRLRS